MKVDLSYLREMSGGNQSLVLEMIDIFKSQVKEFTEGLETHYEKKEFEQLGKLAHKAKSSVAVMGMKEVADQLKELEILAQEGKEVDRYESMINEFLEMSQLAIQELENMN